MDEMLSAWDAWVLWCEATGMGRQDLQCPHPHRELADGFSYRGHRLNVCPHCRERFRAAGEQLNELWTVGKG